MKKTAFDFRKHSRDKEAEADRYAYHFMKRTGFDCHAIKTCLQLLDKVDDSLLYKPVQLEQVFNFPDYPFKKKWIQKQSAIFSQLDKNDGPLTKKEKDSLKTHPDCTQRIALLEDSLQAAPAGQLFLVNEKLFRQLKEDFPVEMMELNYKQDNISRNLYYALLQLQDKEHEPVAVYTIARALNDIYVAQRDHQLGLKVSRENRYQAEDYNLLLRMIDRLHLDEIAALNYNFCKRYESAMQDYAGFKEEMDKASARKQAK